MSTRVKATFSGWAATAGVLAILAGCSSNGPADDDPYAEEFAWVIENPASDFEREVLEDGEVTREEYDRAHELFLECMEQTYPPDGLYVVSLEVSSSGFYSTLVHVPAGTHDNFDDNLYGATYDVCAHGTIEEIGHLYMNRELNPERLTLAELMVRCLVDEGVVDSGYTVDNFEADFRSGSVVTETNPQTGETTVNVNEAAPGVNPDDKTDLDIDSDEVNACWSRATGS